VGGLVVAVIMVAPSRFGEAYLSDFPFLRHHGGAFFKKADNRPKGRGAEIKNFVPKSEHWSDWAFLVQKSGAE
jgi:hypothetical protein